MIQYDTEVENYGLKLRRLFFLAAVSAPAEKSEAEKERDLKRQRLEEAAKLQKEENRRRKELESKRKPKVTLTGKPNRKSKEGETFCVEAKFSGDPAPQVTWSKEKMGELNHSDSIKYRIVREDGFTSLTLNNTMKSVRQNEFLEINNFQLL